MCDFSLEIYRTRLAREGETYKTARFPSGTIGLAPMGGDTTPVCVPYDTQLILEDIPQDLQDSLAIRARENVTFVRLEQGPYRDGVKFHGGMEISLQRLGPGVRATVTVLLENMARAARAAAMI
jgi:hypothetical protein